MKKRNQRGFSLIELIIVIVVISILSLIAIARYNSTIDKTRYTTAKYNLRMLHKAQVEFFVSNGRFAEQNEISNKLPQHVLDSDNFYIKTYLINNNSYYAVLYKKNNEPIFCITESGKISKVNNDEPDYIYCHTNSQE
ncbi:MAG: prepilin-type N-terminal cleavage/methylation domain-containing protein [Endomicrobia bacterium]|nr:prepilin-type N-terminal cleavage/methylation domain-containing protein [Endomicrobiia bacterium]